MKPSFETREFERKKKMWLVEKNVIVPLLRALLTLDPSRCSAGWRSRFEPRLHGGFRNVFRKSLIFLNIRNLQSCLVNAHVAVRAYTLLKRRKQKGRFITICVGRCSSKRNKRRPERRRTNRTFPCRDSFILISECALLGRYNKIADVSPAYYRVADVDSGAPARMVSGTEEKIGGSGVAVPSISL